MRKEKKMRYLMQINNCCRCPRGMMDSRKLVCATLGRWCSMRLAHCDVVWGRDW